MKSSEYWQNRMNSIEQSRFESAFKAYKASEKAFTAAQRQLDQQIEVWVNRIAVNNEVSYTEARRLLKGVELEEFKWDVEQYIAAGRENAVSQQWMKQLENASARSHISRLEAMKVELQQQIETAYGVQQSTTADLLTQVYQDSYYHTAYEVQKGVGVGWEIGGVNEKALDRAVNGWATDEKSFSDRIWSNRTQMVNELQQQLTVQIATGAAPDDAIAALEKYVDKDIKSAKSKAGTLVMTESAAIGNAAQMDAYKELGVEEYEIVETLDSLTCPTCGDWDGQHFPIEEFQIGATAPPFHPNCRGCTAPWFDDDEETGLVGERVARDENGDRYYVPGDMSYEEWKEEYVRDAMSEADRRKYDALKETLGSNMPTEKEWLNIKSDDSRSALFKAYTRAITKGDVSSLTNFSLYESVSTEIDEKLVGITSENGIIISGKSMHFIDRVIGSIEQRRSGVSTEDAKDALLHPVEIRSIRSAANGISQKFIGERCMVAVNPATGLLIQANPR